MMDFSTLPKIVAVDFDGYLVEDKFPEVGEPRAFEIALIKALYQMGVRIILWTSRTDERLKEAIETCENFGLAFDAVNTNIAEVKALTGRDTRKVYADLYLDDRAGAMSALEVASRLGFDVNTLLAEQDKYLTSRLNYVIKCANTEVPFEHCMGHLKEAFQCQEKTQSSPVC